MRLDARLERLERGRATRVGNLDVAGRQAWLREQRLPEHGDRVAALLAIFDQAGVPLHAADAGWDQAIATFLSPLSLDELKTLADRLRP